MYARPEGKQPYSTYSEYTSSLQGEEQTRPPFYEYLDHIRTDGSADGFLQYVVLRLLADRFYLFWHAWLHSFPIIATSEALEELLSTNYETPQQPAETLRAARALDLEPTVEFNEDKVVVKVVTFNEWQGFQRQMFSITRRSPHKIVQHETETLVAWVNPAVP